MYDNWDNNRRGNCFGKGNNTAHNNLNAVRIIGAVDLVDCARTMCLFFISFAPSEFGGNNCALAKYNGTYTHMASERRFSNIVANFNALCSGGSQCA